VPSLYIHVPFCRRKCPYCDFFSVAIDDAALSAYPRLLVRHLEIAPFPGEPFDTVFFGGGTPTLLPPEGIAEVLDAARRSVGLADDAEITMEANPGTVSPATLAGYRSAGVNRLSFGIQSLQDENLRLLGRLHTAATARQAVIWAREAGFANLSCDLMFALPGQTPLDLHREIGAFLDLAPDHLSCYGLSVEENTPFYHLHRAGGLELPGEELFARLYCDLHATLSAAGFRHYEISNFARPDAECRHNLAYWRRRPYLGIGAGAHSFRDCGWGERSSVPPDLDRYAAAVAAGEDPAEILEEFDRRGARAETMYLGLRTAEGVAEGEFRDRFGSGVAEAWPAAVRRSGQRLRQEHGYWRLDLEGWLLYDHLISAFL
jgi:oxygen-independent coproporphyrinogen-3 oxidase